MENEHEVSTGQLSGSDKIWEEWGRIQMGERIYTKKPQSRFLKFLVGKRLHDIIIEKYDDIHSDPTEMNLYDLREKGY